MCALYVDKEIVGGLMYLTCQYNGNDLYSNHWDLCTVEEGLDDRVINCPIRAGRRKFVKELKIPNYLPKVITVELHMYVRLNSFCMLLSSKFTCLSTHADRQGVDMSFTVCVCLFFLYCYGFLRRG